VKILLVVDQMSVGGIENWLISIVKGLREMGHDPVAFPMSRSGLLLERLEQTGIKIRSITDDVKELGFFKPKMIKAFRRVVREEAPDVVHTCDNISGHIGRIACVGLGIPTVHHLRSVKPHGKAKYRVAAAFLSFFTTRYIAVSQAVADMVLVKQNLASRPYSVLYNCINDNLFESPEPLELNQFFPNRQGGPIIFSCGRLVPLKNIDLLLSAYAQVLSHVPDAHLLILGDGSERSFLENLAESLGVEASVCFTGFRNDIPSILSALGRENSVFVMPSDYEGFSNSLTEALHCGVPAVISNKVPNMEMTGAAASVVERDIESITSAILDIITDSDEADRMRNAAKLCVAELTVANYVRKLYDTIYDPIVSH